MTNELRWQRSVGLGVVAAVLIVAAGCTEECPVGSVRCGQGCTPVARDPLNCGACGNACGAGEVCNDGECVLSCVGGTTKCGGACVTTGTDVANCGACGNACASGEVCSSGQCGLTCVGGTTKCGSACVTTDADVANCGACGNACASGEVCSSGQCGLTCVGGTTKCGSACVTTDTDVANCGACGNACASGEVCSGGQCGLTCVGGTTKCGGACVTTDTDVANCGACGNACASGEVCSGGQCGLTCVGGTTKCGGACVDLAADPRHCGACDAACTATQVCRSGACTCLPGTLNCINPPEDAGPPAQRPDSGVWFVDGGVTASGIPFVVNVGEVPTASAGDQEIEVVRAFECDEAAVGAETDIVEVRGAPGERLMIKPSGGTPCTYDLFHRSDAGVDARLSQAPGGYLMGSAVAVDGVRVACVSQALHSSVTGAPPTSREVQQVPVWCWASIGPAWLLPVQVVAPHQDWAAWVTNVDVVPGVSGEFTVTWTRDSTFQFLNLSDFGRPATDGVWRATLSLGTGALLAGPATQISPSVHGAVVQGDWAPTPDEVVRYEGLVDFDAGACAEGCVTDAGL